MERPPDRLDPLMQRLASLAQAKDRAALATLRRGLGKPPGAVPEIFALVLPWLPKDLPRWEEDLCLLIASLFAAHPAPGGSGSLGAAFAELAAKERTRRPTSKAENVERRFLAVLSCHAEELPDHLRHAISLLASQEIPIGWAALLADLRRWNHPDRFVQRRWAHDFWGRSPEAAASDAASQTVQL